MDVEELNNKSKQLRKKILDIVYSTGKGHIGGTYSILDILVYLYYGNVLNFNKNIIFSEDRDVLLIGKGHACLATYCIFNDLKIISDEELNTFGKNGSNLGSQFDIFSYGEYNTGSLGHVIGVGAGYATALKLMKNTSIKVYTIVGDGECEEGSIWESIDYAVKHELNNLIVIVDRNKLGVTDFISNDMLKNKFEGFGADCIEIDGHNFEELSSALGSKHFEKFTVIICNTVKGKGVSFMENNSSWHQSTITKEQYSNALLELI